MSYTQVEILRLADPDSEGILRPEVLNQEAADHFFRVVRESGKTNMLGAAPYLEYYWGISTAEAKAYHSEWINPQKRRKVYEALGMNQKAIAERLSRLY